MFPIGTGPFPIAVGLNVPSPNKFKTGGYSKNTGKGTHEKGQRVPLKTKQTRPNVANHKGACPFPHVLKQLQAKAEPRPAYSVDQPTERADGDYADARVKGTRRKQAAKTDPQVETNPPPGSFL